MPNSQHFRQPAPPRGVDPFDGVLLVDKPTGPTSHDIVARIRRHFGLPKVGHGGTLDPRATGLLVILLGKGTKLSGRFLTSDKTYEGTMRLGIETDSHDADGKIVREADWSAVTPEMVEGEMQKLTGDSFQTPPMVSAVKIDGVPLYKRARKGQEIAREPRFIHVYEFSLGAFRPPEADFMIRCSKGTYVRVLCADVGTQLGCGAHLQSLRRTQSGEFTLDRAVSWKALMEMDRTALKEHIVPIGALSRS